MKCPKCGRISFDYLENCSNCGQDLREIVTGLGYFVKPDPELIWFGKDSKTDSIGTEAEVFLEEQEAGNPAELSKIDASDLVDASDKSTEIGAEGIDSDDLRAAANDKSFQQALDQVLKNE
jgi:hypothetical protein